jgi:cell division control protein 6
MHFPPYTKQQIVEIFTKCLEESGVLDLFPPVVGCHSFSRFEGYSKSSEHWELRIEMAEEEMRKSGKLVDLKKLEAVIEEISREQHRQHLLDNQH